MPQLVPFYFFFNPVTFLFAIVVGLIYVFTKHVLPRFVRVTLTRLYISRPWIKLIHAYGRDTPKALNLTSILLHFMNNRDISNSVSFTQVFRDIKPASIVSAFVLSSLFLIPRLIMVNVIHGLNHVVLISLITCIISLLGTGMYVGIFTRKTLYTNMIIKFWIGLISIAILVTIVYCLPWHLPSIFSLDYLSIVYLILGNPLSIFYVEAYCVLIEGYNPFGEGSSSGHNYNNGNSGNNGGGGGSGDSANLLPFDHNRRRRSSSPISLSRSSSHISLSRYFIQPSATNRELTLRPLNPVYLNAWYNTQERAAIPANTEPMSNADYPLTINRVTVPVAPVLTEAEKTAMFSLLQPKAIGTNSPRISFAHFALPGEDSSLLQERRANLFLQQIKLTDSALFIDLTIDSAYDGSNPKAANWGKLRISKRMIDCFI